MLWYVPYCMTNRVIDLELLESVNMMKTYFSFILRAEFPGFIVIPLVMMATLRATMLSWKRSLA
jgi:hypothetical protein